MQASGQYATPGRKKLQLERTQQRLQSTQRPHKTKQTPKTTIYVQGQPQGRAEQVRRSGAAKPSDHSYFKQLQAAKKGSHLQTAPNTAQESSQVPYVACRSFLLQFFGSLVPRWVDQFSKVFARWQG